jgi:transposase-like protein
MARMRRYTLRDFEKQFPDDAACLDWLKSYLYPDGIHCKRCQKVTLHHRAATRPSFCCDRCGNHVHPTAGTIYHKSSTPLRLWFYAIFLMASTRCGISAKQLERELGVTYKTAWRMFKQIRSMLAENREPLTGEVEIDETYVGGKKRMAEGQKGRGRGAPGKVPVLGIIQRQGSAVVNALPDIKASTMMPIIRAAVPSTETRLFTDELPTYQQLTWMGYPHKTIRHGDGIYVKGDTHTNTVEGFWGLFKPGIKGVYRRVSPKYLQTYLNEYAFRYNRRHAEQPMFLSFLGQVEKARSDD